MIFFLCHPERLEKKKKKKRKKNELVKTLILRREPSRNLIFIKARYIFFHLEKNVYTTSVEYEAWPRGFTGLFFFLLGYNMESLLLIRSYKRNGMLQIYVDIILRLCIAYVFTSVYRR